jgi:menaquinone-dependent protoporphyrinogen oxidase
MATVLIVYASFDGQTLRIAERIAACLRGARHAVTVLPVDAQWTRAAIDRNDAVIVGGAVRFGHHARELEALVRAEGASLARRPCAFFSVSMSAARPGAGIAQARRMVEEFLSRTGWHPASVAMFAGALRYKRYNPFIRFMMRLISRSTGASTDTSRDHEYTDWAAVDRFALQQARELEAVSTLA